MSFFEELKRRNVVRVGIAYVIVAWLVLQVSDVVLNNIAAPEWVFQVIMLLLGIGFPVVLLFAWAFELTPEGIRREKDVNRDASITPQTGRKLDRTIITILVVALAWFAWDKFSDRPADEGPAGLKVQAEQPVSAEPAEAESSDASIAVLPFTTRSTSEEDRFFSDGMHDDLLTQLAKIGSLKVISRTSVMEYRDTTKNLRQIGQELGAANILEGAVQRVGNQVRINVQLIDSESDEHLWAETYDRAMSIDNLLTIQSEMARAISSALHATLSPSEVAALSQPLTDNLEALEAYRLARLLSRDFVKESLDRAEKNVRIALDLDPDFADAWAELAYIMLARWWAWGEDPELLEKARAAIDRGRAINPDLLEIDISEAYYHYWGHLDYPKALAVLEPRLVEFPNHRRLLEVAAYANRRYGRIENALELLLRAGPLGPRELALQYSIGETYAWLRRWPEAERYLKIIEALDSSHHRTYQLRSDILAGRDGDFARAAHYLGQASKQLHFRLLQQLDNLFLAGDFSGALEVAKQADAMRIALLDGGPIFVGLTYAYFGDTEAARPLLEETRDALLTQIDSDVIDPNSQARSILCAVVGALKLKEDAVRVCADAMQHLPDDSFNKPFDIKNVAAGLASSGATEEAFELLSTLTELAGGPARPIIEADRRLQPLHDHPGWQQLLISFEPPK
jgi:TolB-like protein